MEKENGNYYFRVLSIVIMGVILGVMEKKMETAILGFRFYVPTSSTWNLHGLLDGVCLWMFWASLFWARERRRRQFSKVPQDYPCCLGFQIETLLPKLNAKTRKSKL